MKYVANHSIDRRSMDEVMWNLEFSLQLQRNAEESNEGISEIHIKEEPFVPHKWKKNLDASPSFDGCGHLFSQEVMSQKLNVGHLWTGFF